MSRLSQHYNSTRVFLKPSDGDIIMYNSSVICNHKDQSQSRHCKVGYVLFSLYLLMHRYNHMLQGDDTQALGSQTQSQQSSQKNCAKPTFKESTLDFDKYYSKDTYEVISQMVEFCQDFDYGCRSSTKIGSLLLTQSPGLATDSDRN